MATILNNSVTSELNNLRIHDPFIYVGDPNKGKPLEGGQLFFGVVGLDPELEDQQKIVYAQQENGNFVPVAQPVLVGAGGYPELNGQQVSLAVNGSYSYKVLDKEGAQVSYIPRVTSIDSQGFSGVIAEESGTVLSGQLTAPFSKIETTTASFYVSSVGVGFNGRYMRKDVDYEIIDTSTINLLTSYPDGTIIVGRQQDPTGQIVPVTEGSTALFVFQLIADAVSADLQVNDTLTINGGLVIGDGLGGSKYLVVANGTGTADGENFIDLDNGNQIQLIPNNNKLKRYTESVASAASVAGNLNLDLESGGVFEVTLTESVGDVIFLNVNTNGATTVTLKVTQDSATPFTIAWPSSILWSGGVAPVVSSTLDAIDLFVFVTYDGVTWLGSIAGQEFA